MYCLLCHEKIPRLRAWRTKSEFCCDEHAALYKKQTLERLLVDPGMTAGAPVNLPEPPEPEALEIDEPDAVVARVPENTPWARFELPEPVEEPIPEPTPVEETEHAEAVDELWRLADEVGERRRATDRFDAMDAFDSFGAPRDVRMQSAEEALEALRNLARKGGPKPEEPPEPRRAAFEMPASSHYSFSEDDLDERAMLREIRDLEEAPEPELTPLDDPEQAPARYDAEERSLLEHLMTGPAMDAETPERFENFLEPPLPMNMETSEALPGDEAADALQDLVRAFEPRAEALPADLDAPPEPEWDFDPASDALVALDVSLVTSGAPPVPYEEPRELDLDLDISPDEPEWEALEGVDLDAAYIEAPEPELEDDLPTPQAEAEPTAAPEIPSIPPPVVEPAAKAATNGIAPPARPSAVRRTTGGRFRAVTTFAEIQIEPAGAPRADERGWQGQSELDEPAEPWLTFFLPAGSSGDQGKCGTLSMYEGSVTIEPEASLEVERMSDGAPAFPRDSRPFEPDGLFFDVASSNGGQASPQAEDEDEVEAKGTGAASRGRSGRS